MKLSANNPRAMTRFITAAALAIVLALPTFAAADEVHGTITGGSASQDQSGGQIGGTVGTGASGQVGGTVTQPQSSGTIGGTVGQSAGGGGSSSSGGGGGGSILAGGGGPPNPLPSGGGTGTIAVGGGGSAPIPLAYYGVNQPASGLTTTSVGVSSPSAPNSSLTGSQPQEILGPNQVAAAAPAAGSGLGAWWWAIAAAILVVIGLGWWGYSSYAGRGTAGY